MATEINNKDQIEKDKDADTAENTEANAADANNKSDEKDAKGRGEKKLKAEIEELRKTVESLRSELDAEKDKYLRMLAEYDNYRRRSAKEKEGIYSDAYCEAVAAILPVVDNLERAVEFSSDGEKMAEGVAMTLKGFKETMEKLNVTEIDAMGKTFDPEVHNAVMHTEDESKGESEIVAVFQKGYKCGDKIIRHAMVTVAN